MRAFLRDHRDRLGVALCLLPPAVLVVAPHPVTVALTTWWIGNTVAHHAVHRRLFVESRWEAAFSIVCSLLLGVPQELWRVSHRAHHAGIAVRWRTCRGGLLAAQVAALVGLATLSWLGCMPLGPLQYAAGLGLGLVLAFVHGHYEHRGGVTDVRARWWNVWMLNDGFHAAHHRHPSRHWRELPAVPVTAVHTSCLPPPLRWLSWFASTRWLDVAERVLLHCAWLQRPVLSAHRRALRRVLADVPAPARVLVVGGGLFPRSAILLRELWPAARITVLDASVAHLQRSRPWLPAGVTVQAGRFPECQERGHDLVVLPLALRGDRAAAVAAAHAAGARNVVVHDWLWCSPPHARRVALWLAKSVWLSPAPLPRAVPAAAHTWSTSAAPQTGLHGPQGKSA